jgi:hypothetical protein
MDGMTPRDPSPGNPPGAHLFVDESKERDYVLVAGVIAPADLATTRAFTRSLIYRGQARLHMKEGIRTPQTVHRRCNCRFRRSSRRLHRRPRQR